MVEGPAKIDLRVERLNKGLSIRALSRAIPMNMATIRAAEAGRPLTPQSAFRLATFFGHLVSDVWDLS